ncbi:hypothetical protein ASPCAL04910 [Aspergillus calidoustus]|uniref:Uncharacterized protein n=1 Tax=Aspergillus calidoustus TaxID=454130 RepID=A0A0U5FWS5_ASPCI|nr:hypothetical protein ASPCAL04910 [Aspergillus calidoustus]
MSWTQQAGFWSRPLDCYERYFQLVGASQGLDGHDHFLLVGAVQIEDPAPIDLVAGLRSAWKCLRLRHPDIATTYHPGEKRYSPIRTETELDTWCDLTFHVEEAVQSSGHLLREQHLAGSHATCHWIPASNEICIVSGPYRLDEYAITTFLHQLLSHLHNPYPLPANLDGSEARQLFPPLDIVVGMPTTRDPSWSRRADKLIALHQRGGPSIGLPIDADKVAAKPMCTRHVELRIPAKQATALRDGCHERDIALSGAMHTSVVVETAARAPQCSLATRYISLMAFDLRRHWLPPFGGPTQAPLLRMTGIPINIDARAPWSELVQIVEPMCRQTWERGASDMLFVRVAFAEKVAALVETGHPAPPDQPQNSSPYFFNMGALEERIQRSYGETIHVRNVQVFGQMLSKQVYVRSWSWGDAMYLSACYNEAYYADAYVDTFLMAIRDNLVENLSSPERRAPRRHAKCRSPVDGSWCNVM